MQVRVLPPSLIIKQTYTMKEPRKVFSVFINDQEYHVYDIEGREHKGYNGEPTTWWLYFSRDLPEGLVPSHESESFVPYSLDIERRLWDIKITSKTTTKEKWDETRFTSCISVEMWCNKKLVYSFGTFAPYMEFAMAKITYLKTIMGEHSFNFFEPEKEHGRKICWYGLPATVRIPHGDAKWEIGIVPDYTAGLTKEEWWKELRRREFRYGQDDKEWEKMEEEDFAEDKARDYINWGDALSDAHIYWFRK